MNVAALPAPLRLRLGSGTIEALKWAGIVFMLVDHVNAVFFSRDLGLWAEVLGRLAFPLFAVVFGVNLGRDGADVIGAAKRLTVVGAVAELPHALLFGWVGPWPLNVLLTFALAAAGIVALERKQWHLFAGVVIAGALVEYWWPGVALVLCGYALARHGLSLPVLAAGLLALAGLCVVNGNTWALLAVPLIARVQAWNLAVPRSGRFFLWFYPAHLGALVLWAGV